MNIIDLTLPITAGMPVFPGDPAVSIRTCPESDTGGFVVHEVTFGTHTGTHLDTPVHVGGTAGADDPRILDAVAGEAVLVSVEVRAGEEITPAHLGSALNRITHNDRIIMRTGWSARFGKADYFTSFPSLSQELADFFVNRRIIMLGIDTPSLHISLGREIHNSLLGAGIVIVENLANLDRIPFDRFVFMAAPLALTGLDGSPVRAFALIDTTV